MQVFDATRHVPPELQGVLGGERAILDHLPDIKTIDELENDEGWTTGDEVGVDHLHHVRVVGDLKECPVFFLEPLDG